MRCHIRVARVSVKLLRVMLYSGKACWFHVLSLAVFPLLISARDRKLGCGPHLWLWRLECKLKITFSAQHQLASIPFLYTKTIGLRPLHRNRGPAVAAPALPAMATSPSLMTALPLFNILLVFCVRGDAYRDYSRPDTRDTESHCYYPSGDLEPNNFPCGDLVPGACCPIDHYCMSNGLCLSNLYMAYQRATCTDQSWRPESCPIMCPDCKLSF